MKTFTTTLFLIMICSCTAFGEENKLNILVIGDSHTAQSFGIMMHGRLSTLNNTQVATYGRCGSSPVHWTKTSHRWVTPCGFFNGASTDTITGLRGKFLKTPLVDNLLANIDPAQDIPIKADLVVVALGANQINSVGSDPQLDPEVANTKLEDAANTVVALVDKIRLSGAKCVWIGPPDGSLRKKPKYKQDRLYEMLVTAHVKAGNYCQFLSSRESSLPFMSYPKEDSGCQRDGAHLDACTEGRIKSVMWVERMISEIKTYVKERMGHNL
ncbi:MAG: hypothetical protein HOE90_23500 [Bacteriovoracaceae bacterium]|nr:hypothetical protein [Bacteriovoracaceae bacterium]